MKKVEGDVTILVAGTGDSPSQWSDDDDDDDDDSNDDVHNCDHSINATLSDYTRQS
jgi:hypothetical protein